MTSNWFRIDATHSWREHPHRLRLSLRTFNYLSAKGEFRSGLRSFRVIRKWNESLQPFVGLCQEFSPGTRLCDFSYGLVQVWRGI